MPRNKPLKVIVDTNLWVSFIISNKHNLFDGLLFDKKARLVFSAELITEIEETIKKPKLKKYFEANAMHEMLSAFEPFIDLIQVKSVVAVCRDPKDNFLLALAKDGKQITCSRATMTSLPLRHLVRQKFLPFHRSCWK